MKSLIKFTLALLPFVLITLYIVFKDYLPTYTKNNELVEETIIPDDWYPHAFGTSSVMFTRSRFLQQIGDTETYAYSEQITVSTSVFTGDQGYPENWEFLEWTKDDESLYSKDWLVIDEMKVFKIDGEAGGAGGGELTYFIFDGPTVHTLSLYPSQNSPNRKTFESFVLAYIEDLKR